MSRPIITDKTTLNELAALGATTLSDIPIVELLEYIRNTCISVASDAEACSEMGWEEDFTDATMHIQNAIDAVDRAIPRTL